MGINQLEYKIDNTSFNGMHSIKEQLIVIYFFFQVKFSGNMATTQRKKK